MARIAGIDLPKDKRIEIGLTYVYGIGSTSAKKILEMTGVDLDTMELVWQEVKRQETDL